MQTYYEVRTCLGQYGSVSWLFALVKFSCWTLIWVVGSSWITFLSPLDHVAFAFLLLHAHHDPNFVKPCRRTLKFNGLFLRTHDCIIIQLQYLLRTYRSWQTWRSWALPIMHRRETSTRLVCPEILSEIHSDVTAARCKPLHGEGMRMAFRLCCVHSPFPKDLSGFSSSCSESTQAFWINMARFQTSYKVVSWYMYWPRASYVDKVALAVHAARVECVSGHACSLQRIWGAMLLWLLCFVQNRPILDAK